VFGLGWQEILLILVVALVVFGPKKLPEIGSSLGKGLREFKEGMNGAGENLKKELDAPVTGKASESAAALAETAKNNSADK